MFRLLLAFVSLFNNYLQNKKLSQASNTSKEKCNDIFSPYIKSLKKLLNNSF